MINIYKTVGNVNEESERIERLKEIEVGSWIELINPIEDEIKRVIDDTNISKYILHKALTPQEKSKIEIDGDTTLLNFDVPIVEIKNKRKIFRTESLSIIVVDDKFIITISSKELDIFNSFKENEVKGFATYKKTRFTFQILYRVSEEYLKNLKLVKEATDKAEQYLETATQNKELIYLLNVDKSLVYLTTSLKYNETIFERLLGGNLLPLHEEDKDILETTLVKTKQALELASIYKNILKSLMDAFGTISSNNLNKIMKFLAGVTIIFSIPTMIASFMGMNVPLGFYENNDYSFLIILGIALILSIIVAIILKKKNML